MQIKRLLVSLCLAALLFASCATTKKVESATVVTAETEPTTGATESVEQDSESFLADFEPQYSSFESACVVALNEADDKALPNIYEEQKKSLERMLDGLYDFSSQKVDPERSQLRSLVGEYRTRWQEAVSIPFERLSLIRIKNSGNYTLDGDDVWLAFQEKYGLVHLLDRVIRAYRDESTEIKRISDELFIDVALLEGKLNEDQNAWMLKTMTNIAQMGFVMGFGGTNQTFRDWRSLLGAPARL
jgi:hypothetical protein